MLWEVFSFGLIYQLFKIQSKLLWLPGICSAGPTFTQSELPRTAASLPRPRIFLKETPIIIIILEVHSLLSLESEIECLQPPLPRPHSDSDLILIKFCIIISLI